MGHRKSPILSALAVALILIASALSQRPANDGLADTL